MRLSIRWQLALVSVALSLLPMAITGVIAYRSARGALEERIRFNLETLASLTAEKLERLLLDRHQNLRGLVATRLPAGRHGDGGRRWPHPAVSAARPSATSISIRSSGWRTRPGPSSPRRCRGCGPRSRRSPWLQAARRGDAWAGTPELQELTGRVGMPLAFPIRGELRSRQDRRCPRRRSRLAENRRDSQQRQGPARGTERARLPGARRRTRRDSHRAAVSERMGAREDAPQQPRARGRSRAAVAGAPAGSAILDAARRQLSHGLRDDRGQTVHPRHVAHGPADAHRRGVRAASRG